MSKTKQRPRKGNGLTLYTDGATLKIPASKSYLMAWAILAMGEGVSQDQHAELSRAALGAKGVDGMHEYIAFIKAVELAKLLGADWSQLTVHTDDQFIGKASFWLHPGNLMGSQAEKVQARFEYVLKHMADIFPTSVSWTDVERVFQQSRVVEIRSHKGYVYQERADFLCKRALQQQVGLLVEEGRVADSLLSVWGRRYPTTAMLKAPVSSFEEWLQTGVERFSNKVDAYVSEHFPFCGQ